MSPREKRQEVRKDDGATGRGYRATGDEDGLFEATADPAFYLMDPPEGGEGVEKRAVGTSRGQHKA